MTQHVVIIGAGITGLSIALGLKDREIPFTLLEASQRTGGRIFSPEGYDLGPAWFWPGQQRIMGLLKRLNLTFYSQQDDGFGLHHTAAGLQRLPSGYIPMSYRVEKGLAAVTSALTALIGEENIRFAHRVSKVEQRSVEQMAVTVNGGSTVLDASHVIVALPPRLAEHTIVFKPTLPSGLSKEMREMPTWMAGSAKVLIRYDRAFWKSAELSGTAFSQAGPLSQIHEASLPNQNEAALFGFLGSVTEQVRNNTEELEAAVIRQLVTLFGESARHPLNIHIKDWRDDINVATPADAQPLYAHPRYGLSETSLWTGKLMFSGTESVVEDGGLVEGALIAAERTLQAL